MNDNKYLKIHDVAVRLRKHPRTIRDYIATGCVTERGRVRLDASKVGRDWLIHPEWLALFEHRIRPVRRADIDLE